tara:strand:+ start:209 stop:733 length:525 start_codon:yes stop_codon:yes gene_type:complete
MVSGSLIKIDEVIVSSAVASVTLGGSDWDSSYDVYVVQIVNAIPDTDAVRLETRFTVSGTEDSSSNYDRAFNNLRADTSFGDISSANVSQLDLGTTGTGTQEMMNITQYLFNFNNSSEYSFTTVEASSRNNDGHLRGFQGGGVLTVAQATDGVKYFFHSGNIASGTFTLYGLKK